jgi:3-hydroxypropanoate dehydrogenase
MLKLARPATVPEPTRASLDAASLSRLFLEPRTHSHWLDLDVPDELLEEAWNLTRLAPTSANGSPMRLVLLRSPEEKERLVPALDAGNRAKSLTAPVVAILAYDCEFWRTLPRLYPHTDAAAWFRDDPLLAEETALRNGTLQAAWYMLALRALGLDVGPLSGFNSAAVDRLFFAGTSLRTNLILNIGHGDPERLRPRLPRLDFHEVVVALAPW